MITMPGRSRVALMLLISSPRRVNAASDSLCKLIAFRKFQTAARRSDAWNNRGTPGKLLPNAKTQYKRALSSWSIVVRVCGYAGKKGPPRGALPNFFFRQNRTKSKLMSSRAAICYKVPLRYDRLVEWPTLPRSALAIAASLNQRRCRRRSPIFWRKEITK